MKTMLDDIEPIYKPTVKTSRDIFKRNLAKELGLHNVQAIGETDDLIHFDINNDTKVKQRIKDYMKLHNWKLLSNTDKSIPINPDLPSYGTVRNHMVTYVQPNSNHKIAFFINHDNDEAIESFENPTGIANPSDYMNIVQEDTDNDGDIDKVSIKESKDEED